MFYASARQQKNSVLQPSFLLPLVNALTSILGSITLFSFLGHVSTVLEVDMKEMLLGGYNLAFIAYPGFLTTLALPNLWAFLFFLMLLLLGIDSVFGMHDAVIGFGWDLLAKNKLPINKQCFVLVEMAALVGIGFLFTSTTGWWWLNIF